MKEKEHDDHARSDQSGVSESLTNAAVTEVVSDRENAYRRALERIRDGDDSCRCEDHHSPECCANADYDKCAFCIASQALEAGEHRQEPHKSAGAAGVIQQLAEFERIFSAGYDEHGCIGLKEPHSWESCARVALDLAHQVGYRDDRSLSEASASAQSEAPK